MLNLRISVIISLVVIYSADAKIYEKCELALELRDRHFIPMDQIGVYVCIAERQSNLNTEVVGEGLYYGIYQLSSEYWCDVNHAGNACGVHCSGLLDDDLTDDLKCVQTIYTEHQRLFDNGYSAWPSSQYCQSQGSSIVQECFDEDNQIINSYEPAVRREKVPSNAEVGKVYEQCELARELHYQHNIQMDHIATWVCIAKHESAFNTSAIGRLNWDGSEDHGLFQISDIYWCGETGKSCGVQCSELRDNDITNDVNCIKMIHEEHQRLSGDGFNAWAVYPRCKGNVKRYADGCFDSSENDVLPFRPNPGVQQPTKTYVQASHQRKTYQKAPDKGKVYERCELAQELRYKFKIPKEQVATWVCIAKHESDFNTSAVGRQNVDGSEDHGIFQISDLFWCSPGTGCGVACSKFEDNDIADDVECMLKIHEEHQFLSGDGFNAWTVYRHHCQGRDSSYIDGCYIDFGPRPAITQPPKTLRTSTYEPITSKFTEAKLIETTMQPITTSKARETTKSVEKPQTTAKPFNIFDSYFNSFPRASSNNVINPSPKRVFNPTTRAPLTSSTRINEEAFYRGVNVGTKVTSRTTKATRRTTSGNPSSKSTAINRKSTTRTSLTDNQKHAETTKTTPRTTQKITRQSTVLQTKPEARRSPQTKRKAATIKPFNVFAFYLNDYASKAPINYQPVKFSDRSTKIFRKVENSEKTLRSTTQSGSTTSSSEINSDATKRRQEIKFDPLPTLKPTKASTVRALSFYGAYDDYNVNSNRIGRVVQNITPHSFEYLLKLTTPRTAFNRS